MSELPSPRTVGRYLVRAAEPEDVDGARGVMLDTFYREFGYGYVPGWHEDVIDIDGTYLTDPRHLLLVAIDTEDPGRTVVGTTGLLSRGPRHPPHPRWIAERYPSGSTAQLVRVYVRAEHRRRGLARVMVEMAAEFAAVREYASLYLHTNVNIAGAQPFWEDVAKEIFDARATGEHGPGFATVHYEIPLPH
ncbi:GNAT family N-acetyltransferase [Streptomyces calidiresistens]|uniref:GNAT family N-acetyltransferase n=2 Tax=Streptomyces calidiresistens TaxID=1485586 RepID=A0A7W3T4T5_9ACTN|nr:GNAT family N-acetyltransferase [Streptomyces calidiresistens]MBB0230681.1 GNAT family N-acetyltransferase [Streptomyces calidiresistens]